MRIISDFHDYYDSLSYADPERGIIWQRKNDTFDIEILPRDMRLRKPLIGVVGFCGKFYPYWESDGVYSYTMPTEAHYSAELNWGNARYWGYVGMVNWWESLTQKTDIEFFVKMGTPVIHYTWGWGEINPRLQDLQFFKVFDIYTVYQTLTQFYYANFVMPEPDQINISDNHLAAAKGFGHKYAFRKEPKK